MSFTSEVKDEMARCEPECSHCAKATLAALVHIEGTLLYSGKGRYGLEIATEVNPAARLAVKLLHEIYDLKTSVTFRRSVLHKTPNYLVRVPMQPGLPEALIDLGILKPDGGLYTGIKPDLVAKLCCAAAYLRGAFLGSGFVSDPRGNYHFEITVEQEQLAQGMVELMAMKGIHARVMQRRNSYMVYLKSGVHIADFLTFTQAHASALKIEDARVMKSVRNEVNRGINAEVANQAKASKAAVEQIFAMRTVVEAYGMKNLPSGLQEIIRLRVAHPDVSLKELGLMAKPPLSKSAVYHRIRRIEQMAKEAGQKSGKL